MRPPPPAAAVGRAGRAGRPGAPAARRLAAALLACAVLIPGAQAAQAREGGRCACPAWTGFTAGLWAQAAADGAAAGGGAFGASARGASGAPAGAASGAAASGAGGGAADAAGREAAPVAIHAEQLEWLGSAGGAREVRFYGGVQVVQGELQLEAKEVWARYPQAGGSPSALEACGDVRIRQGPRSARCDCVDFERAGGRVVCSGAPAELVRRCEQVRGRSIAFLTGSERFFVEGEARVGRQPGCAEAGGETGAPGPGNSATGAADATGAPGAAGPGALR